MSAPAQHVTDLEAFRELLLKNKITPVPHEYLTLLGLSPADVNEIEREAKRGLPYVACDHLARNTDISIEKLADLLHIISRREEGRLRPDESERLLNAARAYGRVLRFFDGRVDAARDWMMRPALAFNEAKPFDVAQTPSGSQAVERLMDQLDYGVYP